MIDLFSHWQFIAIAGILLLVAEIAIPGFYFLWFGVAALATSGALLIFPDMGWEAAMIIFSISSLIALLLGNRLYKRGVTDKTPTNGGINQRMRHYVGQFYTAATDITPSDGRIYIGDTTWLARSAATGVIPAGSRVKVIDAQGTSLIVEIVKG